MRECYTGRLGTVRRGADACSLNYYRPTSWDTTMDITAAWATRPVDPPVYLLSRWLFLRLLGAVYLVAFGSLAVLYAASRPSTWMRWLLWWLLFRLMFLSGVTKLVSGDAAWRHLTALDYHFWTQPLPTWPAWYVHGAPLWVHRGMTFVILAIELVVPWLIFVPERWRRARYAACALLVLGQLAIAVTGNYGVFILLAILPVWPIVDDGVLVRVLPLRLVVTEPEPRWQRYAIRGVAPMLALLSLLAFAREIVQTLPTSGGALDNPLLRAV